MTNYLSHFILGTCLQHPLPVCRPMFTDHNPFNPIFNHALDSQQQLAELVNDVHRLQDTLAAKLQARRDSFEKKRCCLLHEVKNALTGILSCAEVLGRSDLRPYERHEFFQLIGSEIERIVSMAAELSECPDELHRPLTLQTCSVADVMQELLALIRHPFASRKISIQTDLRYTGPFEIDVEKMKRVFLNIAYNARDAMPDGGTLTIASQGVNDVIQFEFTDTGCGMSAELQARFLEPFVTAGKPNGTGLGMTIVKDILDAHQGQIDVHSMIAQGTTIRISLPRIQQVGER